LNHASTIFFFLSAAAAAAEISPTMTFAARSRQMEHSRKFPLAGNAELPP
jgi:hypothetical protein